MNGSRILAVVLAVALVVGLTLTIFPPSNRSATSDVFPQKPPSRPLESEISSLGLPRSSEPNQGVLKVYVRGFDEKGAYAVESARVLAFPRDSEALHTAESPRGETDALGVCSLWIPRAGRWSLRAMAQGFVGRDLDLGGADKERGEISIVLEKLGEIRGVVKDLRGSPIGSSTVEVYLPDEEMERLATLLSDDARSATKIVTDQFGNFAVGKVAPGCPMKLFVSAAGKGSKPVDVDPLHAGETRYVEISLGEPTILTGLAPWEVSASEQAIVTLLHHEVETNGWVLEQKNVLTKDRRFVFFDLKPGPKMICLSQQKSFALFVGFLEATAVESQTVDVGQIPATNTTLQVRVKDDRGLEADNVVSLDITLIDFEEPYRVRKVDHQIPPGAVAEIQGLPSGQLFLNATLRDKESGNPSRDYATYSSKSKFLGAAMLEIDFPKKEEKKGELSIRLTPPPGVEAAAVNPKCVVVRDGFALIVNDSAGPGLLDLDLSGQEPGSYDVYASANGYTGKASASILGGKSTVAAVNDWRFGPTIRGTVTDSFGNPVSNQQVFLLGQSKNAYAALDLDVSETDSRGQFAFPAVFPMAGLSLSLLPSRMSRKDSRTQIPFPVQDGARFRLSLP